MGSPDKGVITPASVLDGVTIASHRGRAANRLSSSSNQFKTTLIRVTAGWSLRIMTKCFPSGEMS
jgi:hypothetical protein